jgi:ATP-binding cassette subfamily C protein
MNKDNNDNKNYENNEPIVSDNIQDKNKNIENAQEEKDAEILQQLQDDLESTFSTDATVDSTVEFTMPSSIIYNLNDSFSLPFNETSYTTPKTQYKNEEKDFLESYNKYNGIPLKEKESSYESLYDILLNEVDTENETKITLRQSRLSNIKKLHESNIERAFTLSSIGLSISNENMVTDFINDLPKKTLKKFTKHKIFKKTRQEKKKKKQEVGISTQAWDQFEKLPFTLTTPTEELRVSIIKSYPKSPENIEKKENQKNIFTEQIIIPQKKMPKAKSRLRYRTKTPLVLQLEATECGAACLSIILEYYGCYVPLSELRESCGVSRDGSKASNILKAARQYNLECKGYKKTLDDVIQLQAPYIIFWNFNHFLVVEGINTRKKIVYLNDPAHGYRKVSLQEFDESFTGVVLTFKPGENFKTFGKRTNIWQSLAKRFAPAKHMILYLLLVALLLTIPGLLIPTYTRIFLDEILGESRTDWIKPVIAALAATALFQICLESIKYLCLRRLEIFLSAFMSKDFFQHLLKLPLQFYAQRYSGEISSRQKLNDNMAEILSGKLADTCINILMMIFYAILMFYYNPKLTLIGILFASLSFFILKLFSQNRVDANMKMRQDFGKVVGDSIAALQAMETIKVSGQESYFFSKWSGRYAKAINSMQTLQIASQSITVFPVFFNSITTMCIYLIGGLSVIEGQMSIGTLVAFTALMYNFQNPIKDLVDLGGELQNLDGDLKRLDDVLQAKPESILWTNQNNALHGWPLQLKGRVTLENITYGYCPIEPPLFQNINLDIAPGKWVALVGASGSGKTTLSNIICGLFQPWEGAVLFDNHRRQDIPRPVIINTFAAVSQDIFLFEGTIRDNLTLWDSTVPNEVLYKACEDAAILDVVQAIPGGLDGHLLEGGVNLSGGQRQRLEIARALVTNPTILVLDEATSALDAETEHIIIERLHWRGCTTIMVAHRLSTIRDCDEIIVLEKGMIKEQGTHTQLWKQQGIYANLLKMSDGIFEQDSQK